MRATILIPTHNRPTGLRAAVRSAVAALPENGEVLVVDDHSIPPVNPKDPVFAGSVRVVQNTGPKGAAGARNFGLVQAQGEIIFFLDDDDLLQSDYLDLILDRVLVDHPDIDYGYSNIIERHTAADGSFEDLQRPSKWKAGVMQGSPRQRTFGFGVGFWIRRSVAGEVGPIDTAFQTNEDTDYTLRLFAKGYRGWYEATPGVVVNVSNSNNNDQDHLTQRVSAQKRAEAFLILLNTHRGFLAQHRSMRRHYIRRFLHLLTKSGDFGLWKDFKTAFPRQALFWGPLLCVYRCLWFGIKKKA